jgi:hypothetical protein
MPQTPQKRIAVRALPWGLAAAMLLISIWPWLSLADRAELSLEPTQATTAVRALAPLTLPAPADFEDYRFALERPLFHPSRRPFPDRKALVALEAAAKAKQIVPSPTPAAPPSSAPPPQGFLLRGTVIAGPLQSAIFERSGKDGYMRVREGEQLEGWTLVEITRQNVVLRLGDRTVSWPLAKETESRQRRP